jgi:hypothetical protein
MKELAQLSYEAAMRSLERQEARLEELRARTGVLIAASALAASFLGETAFKHPDPRGLALLALGAFIISIVASVYVLLPKKDLIFVQSGKGLYEGLYPFRDDIPEVYRRLAYDLDRFWESNDTKIKRLTHSYMVAATALTVEILSLTGIISDSLL